MNGGKFESQKQKAIVEFLCDAKAGNDSKVSSIMAAEEEEDNDNEEESDEGGETDDDHGGKIKFVSWETEGDTKVLRLDWTTKYGCEDAKDDSRPSSSGHWGFFAWFIIMCVTLLACIAPLY